MLLLHKAQSAEAYVSARRSTMAEKLRGMIDALDKGSEKYTHTIGSLARLFREASMAMGIQDCSFLDGGFVFRRPLKGIGFVAYPLCYPATLAMLDLLQSKSPAARVSLEKARGDGAVFEDLVWDILLARGFSNDGVPLPCNPLGASTTEVLTLKLDEYFISTLVYHHTKQIEVNAELSTMMARCTKLKLTLLYRCPKGCVGVDFFVLKGDGSRIAIQTSISALLDHSTVEKIADIPSQFGASARQMRSWRYVYVTATPEKGKDRDPTTLTKLKTSSVCIVSADEWIGGCTKGCCSRSRGCS
jgi:hypothetical protein